MTQDFLVNAGLRCDAFSLTREVKLAPRLLVSYQADERTFLKAAWGLYYQTPTYYQLLAASQAGEQPQRMQQAIHYLIGIERTLEKGMRVHAEAYFKQLDALISYDRLRSGDFVYSPRNDSRGEIKGVDFEAAFRDERVMGWLSFSWMVAKEVKDAPGEKWHLRPTDQRMTLNFVFEPRLAENWVLSLRSLYGTGFAYVNDLPGTKSYQIDHYPDYKRIDVRLNYSFETGPLRSTAFVEITNLFSMRNVLSFQGTLYDPSTPDYALLLPMIINVGMKYEY
jgi:outer membrane receptor protein involved in Fe transport